MVVSWNVKPKILEKHETTSVDIYFGILNGVIVISLSNYRK